MRKIKAIMSMLLCMISLISLTSCGKDDTPTLIWYMLGEEQADHRAVMEEINKITIPEIGAKVDIRFVGASSYEKEIKNAMGLGKAFDICFTGYINTYLSAIKERRLLPLDDMLKEMPALEEAIPDDDWESVKYKDKIYAVPNQKLVTTAYAYEVDKELADKYSFDVSQVKKPEDLEPFLKNIAENEPTRFAYRINYDIDMWLCQRYEKYSDFIGIDKETGEIVSIYETPEYREGYKTLNDWYNKGYIRNDVDTQKSDLADYKAGRYAVSSVLWKPETEDKDSRYEYKVIGEPYKLLGYAANTMLGVCRKSKYPDKALKLIELVNTDKEFYNLVYFGIKDKHYTFDENEQVTRIKDSGWEPRDAWKFGNEFNSYTLKGQATDIWDRTKEFNSGAKVSPLNGLIIDRTKLSKLLDKIEKVNSEADNLITCTPTDFDRLYEENLEAFKRAGLDKLVDKFKEQVEDWRAAN